MRALARTGFVNPASNIWSPRFGDGCVLWLPGQDDPQSATIRDRSGQGNDGTITGASWVRNSMGLWTLSFDGSDDQVSCGAGSSLNPTTNSFSIMVWVYKDSASGTQLIMDKEEAGDKNRYGLYVLDGTLAVGLSLKDNNSANFEYADYGNLTALTWQLLTAVINKGDDTAKLYINNVIPVSHSIAGMVTINNPLSALWWGSNGGGFRWKGDLAMLRVYMGRALSAQSINNTFQAERHLFGV